MDKHDKFKKKLAEVTLIRIAETIGMNLTQIDGERLMTDRKAIEEIKTALILYKEHLDNEEESRYYAKIKGHGLIKGNKYWGEDYYMNNESNLKVTSKEMSKPNTKEKWRELGIDNTNADFEEVKK